MDYAYNDSVDFIVSFFAIRYYVTIYFVMDCLIPTYVVYWHKVHCKISLGLEKMVEVTDYAAFVTWYISIVHGHDYFVDFI